MSKLLFYDSLSASAFYDTITLSEELPTEAVFYLLQRRLRRALQHVFEVHGFGLSDEFDDTLDEFFLYLYAGQDEEERPFAMVKGILDKQAFFGWMVSTYRNFLLNKAKEEMKRKALQEEARLMALGEEVGLGEDVMIRFLASAIAYADQRFKPCNRFIFYRSILTLLDHRRAIPQEEMASAMKLHPVTYRVRCKRQRDRFQDFILWQETGHCLELDRRHELMRLCIEEEFKQLYALLIGYYNQVLEQLPARDDIRALRLEYGRQTGLVMHENNCYGYRYRMNVEAFYKALKS